MTDFDNFDNEEKQSVSDFDNQKREKDVDTNFSEMRYEKPDKTSDDVFFNNDTVGGFSSGGTASAKKKSSGDAGVWVITIIILAAFIGLILWAGNSATPQVFGSITGAASFRYGEANQLKLIITNPYNAEGKQVIWYLDGEEVLNTEYGEQAMTLDLSQANVGVGTHQVEVAVGDQTVGSFSVTVNKPLLKVTLPQASIVYGEAIPSTSVTVDGWVDGDTAESTGFGSEIDFAQSGIVPVGEYTLTWQGFESDKYEIEVEGEGLLTVLPKALSFENCQFAKVYDGAVSADSQQIKILGIIDGDQVGVKVTAEYTDKNAGENKVVKIVFCELSGEDMGNYVLPYEDVEFVGAITPLNIQIQGIEANDKVFDGTTSVTFASSGELSGVLATDAVNVGEISARFENSNRGYNKKVIIDKITLIGDDSGNYCVTCDDIYANIVGRRTIVVPSN